MKPARVVVAIALAWSFAARPARAHDFKPALLALTQSPGGSDCAVVWRIPIEAAGDRLYPQFAAGTQRTGGGTRQREGDMLVERFVVHRPGGLGGTAIRLGGSSPTIDEVLIRAELGPGHVFTGRLRTGTAAAFDLPAAPSHGGVAATYLRLGVEHILTGIDHLAFVLALVLLAGRGAAIVRAVTAFTAAHSVTLAAAALGLAHVPQPPVEAIIALSIMFAARELTLRRQGSVRHPPTVMAFAFGLLHGLGFAGALAEVGLPAGDIPLSLLCFNVGVELGQLTFVLVVLGIARLLRPPLATLATRGPRGVKVQAALAGAPALAIGTLGAFWLFERIAGFFA
jgi:hydrogenase/urease accessory protein HupE